MMERAPLVVIAGPTGVGKTATAVALARRLAIEVVGADSRQVYRGVDVATGKPRAAERSAVPHHLLDVVDPDDRYTAARFRTDALAAIAGIRERGRLPVVVGGTGLYIRALLRGLDPAPPADPALRRELAGVAATEGRAVLHERLSRQSPEMARRLHPNDAVRVVRALERLRAGAEMAQHRWRSGESAFDVLYVGLRLPRAVLFARLRARAEAMVAAGLLDEVRTLLGRGYGPGLPALQGIGYREFARVAEGTLGVTDALRLMQRDTMRYAKRQETWFAREPEVEWIDAGDDDAVAGMIEKKVMMRGFAE